MGFGWRYAGTFFGAIGFLLLGATVTHEVLRYVPRPVRRGLIRVEWGRASTHGAARQMRSKKAALGGADGAGSTATQ